MCTIILLYKTLENYPLILAENRDIRPGRLETPPQRVYSGDNSIYCAIDPKSGGTWYGLNSSGVTIGLTNRHPDPDSPTASIGRLCLEALTQPTAKEASGYLLDNFDFAKHRNTNILSADKDNAIITFCDENPYTLDLNPGIHILTNYDFAQEPVTMEEKYRMIDSIHRLKRATELTETHKLGNTKNRDDAISTLQKILSDHEVPKDNNSSHFIDYFKICCHSSRDFPWETKSSSIIALSKDGIEDSIYLYAGGNPCNTKYEDYSDILRDST